MELIGIQGTLSILEEFNGKMIYLPRWTTLHQVMREKEIYDEVDGYSIRYGWVAKKYRTTEDEVKRIVETWKKRKYRDKFAAIFGS